MVVTAVVPVPGLLLDDVMIPGPGPGAGGRLGVELGMRAETGCGPLAGMGVEERLVKPGRVTGVG